MSQCTNGNQQIKVEDDINCELLSSSTKPSFVHQDDRRHFTIEDETHHLSIYNLMCPWDYLVNFSNISTADRTQKQSKKMISMQRINALVNNFELLFNQFRILIEASCSLDAKLKDTSDNSQGDLKCDMDNATSITLTENLSLLLGHTKTLRILLIVNDPEKIDYEYKRCSDILDTVVDCINYKELNGNDYDDKHEQQKDINRLEQYAKAQAYDDLELVSLDNSLYSDEKEAQYGIQPAKKKKRKRMKVPKLTSLHQTVPEPHIKRMRKQIKSIEVVGFKENYCIKKDIYDKILLNGPPYTCPPCQRTFKSRRCFEYHLNGRCLGMSLKERGLEPKWEVEDGKLRCLFPGCEEVYLQKQTLYKHHQRSHISEDVELPWKCKQCNKSFIIKNSLSVHIKEVHKEKTKQCCDICGASVGSKLKVHMLRHTGSKGIVTSGGNISILYYLKYVGLNKLFFPKIMKYVKLTM